MTKMNTSVRAEPDGGRGRSVVEGVFRVLEVIARSTDGMGLTAIAGGSGLPKATVHRLLEQLSGSGAVERWDGRYYIGGRVFRIGQARRWQAQLQAAAREPVGLLAKRTGASVVVAVAVDDEALAVHVEPGEADVMVPVRAGASFPMSTAAGMALQAGAMLVGRASPQPLAGEPLERFRRTGTVIERDRVIAGISCVAAPIVAGSGAVISSIAALVRSGRNLEPLSALVRGAAGIIAGKLPFGGVAHWS